MARKRKKKNTRTKKGQAETAKVSESASDQERAEEKKKPEGAKKGAKKKAPKKKAPKKKPAKKKAAKRKSTQAKSADAAEEMPAAEAPPSEPDDVPAAQPATDPPADEPVVEDLDAVLDDVDESEDLEDLIAATVASAEPEDHPDEPEVTSLDELPGEPEAEEEGGGAARAAEAPATAEVPADGVAAAATEEPEEPAEEDRSEPDVDLVGAIDLGPDSTPELRDRLLAQALAHAELQDARYRVPYSTQQSLARWKGGLAALILTVAAIAVVVPPTWVRPDPPASLTSADRVEGVRSALLLQAQQVDAFRVREQRLPSSLAELQSRLPGIRYVRSGNRNYQLVAYGPDGDAIVYDSIDPAPEFDRLAPGWSLGDAQ